MHYDKLEKAEAEVISAYIEGLTAVWENENKREALNEVVENALLNYHDFQLGPHGLNALPDWEEAPKDLSDLDIWGDGYEEIDGEWPSSATYAIPDYLNSLFSNSFDYSVDNIGKVRECIGELVAYRFAARLEDQSLYPQQIKLGDNFRVASQHFNEFYFNYPMYLFAQKHRDLPIGEYMELALKEGFKFRLDWDQSTFDAHAVLEGYKSLDEVSEAGRDYYLYLKAKAEEQ